MKIVSCRMPDGSSVRVCPHPIVLWWLQAGRDSQTIEAFIESYIAQGNKRSAVERHVMEIMDAASEFQNRVADGYTPEFAAEWANALKSGGLTESSALLLIARKDCRDAVEYLAHDPIPIEHAPYREAYIPNAGTMAWDMGKARERHRQLMRHARKPLLDALDIEYQRADERASAGDKAEISKRKQALRDAPAHPDIEAAQTIDDLVAVWPEVLGTK